MEISKTITLKSSPIKLKQKLSPKASAAKQRRDTLAAKTPIRRAKKAQNQRIGQRSDSDLHHTKNGYVVRTTISNNRNVWKHGERT